jgi:flagellar basal-body rod protein FlgB
VNLTDIPLFAMLKGELNYHNQRQGLLARNVANADTPGYAPMDLKPFSLEQALKNVHGTSGIRAAVTNAAHLQTDAKPDSDWANQGSPDSEVRLDGNHVVLEEQMMKVNQAQGDFTTAVGLYQKSLQMLQTAIKKPGS